MKKILVAGVIAILLVSLFIGLVPSTVAIGDWIIDGDTVYIDDTNVYLSATPHTITSSGWVYFNVTTKSYNGDIDILWGFDSEVAKPSKPQVPNGWENKTSSMTFYNVSSFSLTDEPCYYGHSYNPLHYNVTYQNCDVWNETIFECESYKTISSVVCFDSQTNDGTNYTATWHTMLWRNWNDIPPSRFSSLDYEYQGMNKWYYIKDVSVVAGELNQLRAWIEVPVSLQDISGKYWWALKPSSETISEAISSGHFYSLDPWYSSSWLKRKQVTWTNVNATTLTNYPAYTNVTDEPEMQADWDDVVFTDSNSNLIAYELENYTASYGDYWVNISSLPGSGTYTGWMYYGNDGAGSQENPEGVWGANTAMVHLSQDLNDSTSNDNDATNYGAVYTSSGVVDGAYDYNGSSDYWDCSNDASLNITDTITIGLCMNPDSSQVDFTHPLWKPNAFGMEKHTGIDWRILLYIDSVLIYSTPITTIADVYNHLIYTYNSSTHQIKGYLNGALFFTDTVTGLSVYTLDTSVDNLWIGGRTGFSRFFNGTLDNIMISSTARSADWINQSYELVVNQSSWVSWGSAEESWVNEPINLAETHDNFWVNWTWGANNTGDALHTDSFNTSYWINANHYWDNSTNTSRNETVGAHGWLNISIQAYNASAGKLSSAVSGNQQISNNPITITNTSDWQGNEGELVYLDFNYTDLDGDTCTFATNATEGALNATTGIFEWQTDMASQGTYFWNFTVSDGYGGEDYYVANITVNDLYHPDITDWWNNYTSDNLTHFTILVGDNRTVFFNVTSNQSGMTWYWYKDGDFVQSSSQANYTATWDVGGIGKEIRVYGSNANGNTESLYWIIYIEYTAHEIEWLKYLEMQAQTEAEEMLGLSILLVILIVVALVLFLLGILVPHSVLTLLGAMTFFVTMVLPIPVLANYPYFGIALTSILLLFGLIGVIVCFYQWFTVYDSNKGYHKWDDYFGNR